MEKVCENCEYFLSMGVSYHPPSKSAAAWGGCQKPGIGNDVFVIRRDGELANMGL